MHEAFARLPVVFLITSGRAGSLLLHSLLDGHPQVLSMPVLFDSYAFWAEYRELAPEALIDRLLLHTNLRWLMLREQTREAGDFRASTLDPERLRYELRALLPETPATPRELLYRVHAAYARSRGQDPASLRLILEHSHFYPYRVAQKRQDFPDARFLHIIRDPRASFYSYYKRYSEFNRGYLLPGDWLYMLESCVYGMLDILRYDAEAFYMTLQLEHLHLEPETQIVTLATFLGIEPHPSLFESTLDGLPYISHSGVHQDTSGFSPAMTVAKYHGEFTAEDIRFIESLTLALMRLKQYPLESELLMGLAEMQAYRFKTEAAMNWRGILKYAYPETVDDVAQKSAGRALLHRFGLLRPLVRFRVYLGYLEALRSYRPRRAAAITAAWQAHQAV